MTLRRCFLCLSSVLFLAGSTVNGFAEDRVQLTRSGSWIIATSENFRVQTRDDRLPIKELVQRCESLKLQLQEKWVGAETDQSWSPRCDVILHPSIQSYSRTLGNGAGRSVGCASLRIDSGHVIQRRVDLRLDSETWKTDALPHELTHVVLADRFADYRIPPWVDEGIGVLSESTSKQQERMEACARSREAGHLFQLRELLNLKRFPSALQRDAFYGQSAALVQLLQSRSKSPSQVLDFADHAARFGYERALIKYYGIDDWNELRTIAESYQFEPRDLDSEPDQAVAETAPAPLDVIVD